MAEDRQSATYSQFACIGAGFSAIGLGATLKRWYGITDIQIFERHSTLGGTWHVSKYPGAACDVPSALYSFSFETNPQWSRVLPSREELWAYLDEVARKYDLLPRMCFNTNVESATWIEEAARWRILVRDLATDQIRAHECQFLFAATGQLVTPRKLDIPGAETFEGPIFHSAEWREDVDLTGKKVVLFGNGCTAAQIVPCIVEKTKSLTQIVRSKHWIFPPIDRRMSKAARTLLQYIPGLSQLSRLIVFSIAESDIMGFPMTSRAARFRAGRRKQAERYMRETAPEKYHDLLIPDFEIGCKRRIFDSGYLESLHAENLTLTDEKVVEIVPDGVRTEKRFIEADVIVHANGFETNKFLGDVKVTGRRGVTVEEHWEEFGGPEAYNCTSMSGFPNFFILLGPNATTGHTSNIMASENSINFALRVIKPLLDGEASVADLKPEAEKEYVETIQNALVHTVWNSGCQSWYVKGKEGRTWNSMTYPWSQAYYWYRSLFPVWNHWQYSGARRVNKSSGIRKVLGATSLSLILALLYARFHAGRDLARDARGVSDSALMLLQLLKQQVLSRLSG